MSSGMNNPATFTGYTNIGLIKPSGGQTILNIPIVGVISGVPVYVVPPLKTFFCTSIVIQTNAGDQICWISDGVNQLCFNKNILSVLPVTCSVPLFVATAGTALSPGTNNPGVDVVNGFMCGWIE